MDGYVQEQERSVEEANHDDGQICRDVFGSEWHSSASVCNLMVRFADWFRHVVHTVFTM
jgi:hypothetical protein